jgi:hypothetical protein
VYVACTVNHCFEPRLLKNFAEPWYWIFHKYLVCIVEIAFNVSPLPNV